MKKRPLAVPTSRISKADFLALQSVWDRKLAKSGFRDIEYGQDMNLLQTSTFRGVSDGAPAHGREHHTHGAEHVLGLPPLVADETPNVFSAPRARAWALFSQAAHDLPKDERTRRILVAVAESGNTVDVAKRHRMRRQRVSELVWRLCGAIGIEPSNLFGGVTEHGEMPPLPVRGAA